MKLGGRRTKMWASLILSLLATLRKKNLSLYQQALTYWPELKTCRSRDYPKIVTANDTYTAVFFVTVLYDRMQKAADPGYVFVPLTHGRFGYVRGTKLHKENAHGTATAASDRVSRRADPVSIRPPSGRVSVGSRAVHA